MVQAPSRRDRVRAATIEEIKGTARQLLVDEGPDAVSLRAIGRAMGMTAPALYRYFGNREDLLQHVCGDIFTEIAADIHAEIGRAAQASGGDMTAKLIAACRAFRSWALAHRPEFGLLFGTPLPVAQHRVGNVALLRPADLLFGEFQRHRNSRPAPTAADSEVARLDAG